MYYGTQEMREAKRKEKGRGVIQGVEGGGKSEVKNFFPQPFF